jgi:hypothetical protein
MHCPPQSTTAADENKVLVYSSVAPLMIGVDLLLSVAITFQEWESQKNLLFCQLVKLIIYYYYFSILYYFYKNIKNLYP